MGDAGFWFGSIGALIAVATAFMQYRDGIRAVKHDEIAYLQRQVEDLQRANHVCEQRCEELREEMLHLMAQITVQPKRTRRKRVTA